MLRRLIKMCHADQRGITGLETAIILIAFVMVASVLAYVVLTAGLFSAQKAKEAVHAGLEEVRSTVELKGNVILEMENGFGKRIMFTVGSPSSAEAVDFTDTSNSTNVVVISYSDNYQIIPSMNWTVTRLTSMGGEDNLLDPNELFLITVDLSPVNEGAASDEEKLGAYRKFILEVKPPRGPILTIERTVPARVNQLVNLN